MKTYGLVLPPATELAIISGQRTTRRTRVYVQYPGGEWVGVADTTAEHGRAVAAAMERGWDGLSRMEIENKARVLYTVMGD